MIYIFAILILGITAIAFIRPQSKHKKKAQPDKPRPSKAVQQEGSVATTPPLTQTALPTAPPNSLPQTTPPPPTPGAAQPPKPSSPARFVLPPPPPPPPPPNQSDSRDTRQNSTDKPLEYTERIKSETTRIPKRQDTVSALHDQILIEEDPNKQPEIKAPEWPSSELAGLELEGKQTENDRPVIVAYKEYSTTAGFRLPTPRPGISTASSGWIPAGKAAIVRGIVIPGGMIYVGNHLQTKSGQTSPCLIDPSKPIAEQGDFRQRQTGYWPSYSEISAEARRAYLNWLADGRRDPDADIGYIFLFYYGLERRILHDHIQEAGENEECLAIKREIERLLEVYGERSGSFRGYANDFLDWMSMRDIRPCLYNEKLVVSGRRPQRLSLSIRLALGQSAKDQVPVPAHLAITWATHDPNIKLRSPAIRCKQEFEKMFARKYSELYGDGIIIPKSKRELMINYQAASAEFQRSTQFTKVLEGIPEASLHSASIRKLQEVVEAATVPLEAYSRQIAKVPSARDIPGGWLRLPAEIWPTSAQEAIVGLRERAIKDSFAMPLRDLLTILDPQTQDRRVSLTRETSHALGQGLRMSMIGIEPDVITGAKPPKNDDIVVLFSLGPEDVEWEPDLAYEVASLTLQLASAVAAGDGDISNREIIHLQETVLSWSHLNSGSRRRLLAQLKLLLSTSGSLYGIKKKCQRLGSDDKERIATLISTIAQVDGTVSPEDIRVLEKIYKVIGVDPARISLDLHQAATHQGSDRNSSSDPIGSGFRLDKARIAARQQDTQRIDDLLKDIFSEAEESDIDDINKESHLSDSGPSLPREIQGLDGPCSSLVKVLLTKDEWQREELQKICDDLDLMLDGALEQINDACFDQYELPLIEGEATLTLNDEVKDQLSK